MTTKLTNPKDAAGIRKPPASAGSQGVNAEVNLALTEGSRKYGRHNYRAMGARFSVYFDACIRHLNAWWDYGQDIDPDSGLHHVTKAIASLVVLRDSMIMDNCTDDRPPSLPIEHLDYLQDCVDKLFEKIPKSKLPFLAKSTHCDHHLPLDEVCSDCAAMIQGAAESNG